MGHQPVVAGGLTCSLPEQKEDHFNQLFGG